jgi:hypothetical protein
VSFSGVFHIHLRSGVRTQTCPLFLMPLRQSPRFPLVLWLFTHAGLREGANPNLSAFCIATATIALICRDSFGLLGRSECGKVRTQTCPLFQAWRPQSPVVHAGREGKLMEKRTFREAPMSGVLESGPDEHDWDNLVARSQAPPDDALPAAPSCHPAFPPR